MKTRPPGVPWGQIFTFLRLQNMDHLMTDCMFPCPAELSKCPHAQPTDSAVYSSSLLCLHWSFPAADRLPSSRKLPYQTQVSSSFSLYWGNWCPERRNQKQQPPAHSFSPVHGNRRQHKAETTTWKVKSNRISHAILMSKRWKISLGTKITNAYPPKHAEGQSSSYTATLHT